MCSILLFTVVFRECSDVTVLFLFTVLFIVLFVFILLFRSFPKHITLSMFCFDWKSLSKFMSRCVYRFV